MDDAKSLEAAINPSRGLDSSNCFDSLRKLPLKEGLEGLETPWPCVDVSLGRLIGDAGGVKESCRAGAKAGNGSTGVVDVGPAMMTDRYRDQKRRLLRV